MKNIVLFILMLPIIAAAQNEGFLSKSKILTEAGIKIIPAQLGHANNILPVFSSDSSLPLFLIGKNGLEVLEKIKGAKKDKLHIRTCGADEMAYPWQLKSKAKSEGTFLASGKVIGALTIKCTSAKAIEVSKKSEYVFYKKNYALASFKAAEIEGLKKKIFFSEMKSAEQLKYEEEYKSEKNHDSSRPKIDCSKKDLSYQKIGFLEDSTCNILLESPINCEGQGYKQGSFSKPLGLIEISNGKETEKWLVFLAYGYEGDAFLGIKLNESNAPLKEGSDIDFYIYSGC